MRKLRNMTTLAAVPLLLSSFLLIISCAGLIDSAHGGDAGSAGAGIAAGGKATSAGDTESNGNTESDDDATEVSSSVDGGRAGAERRAAEDGGSHAESAAEGPNASQPDSSQTEGSQAVVSNTEVSQPDASDPDITEEETPGSAGIDEFAEVDLPEPVLPEPVPVAPLEHVPSTPAPPEHAQQTPAPQKPAQQKPAPQEPAPQEPAPQEQKGGGTARAGESSEDGGEGRAAGVEGADITGDGRIESEERTAVSRSASRGDEMSGDGGASVSGEVPGSGEPSETGIAPAIEVPEEKSSRGHRSVWANPGDTVDLFFSGRGWVYDRGSSSAGGVEFQERYYDEERTEFVFRVTSPGSFQLSFFREDLGTGEQEKRIVDLIASAAGRPGKDGGAALKKREEGLDTRETPSTGTRIENAIARSDADFLAKNAKELMSWAAGTSDALEEKDDVATASSSGTVPKSPAGSGTGKKGTSSAVRSGEALELALDAASLLAKGGYEHEARDILDRGLENGSADEDQLERIYFSLGELYEKPGPIRDEPTAVGYYRRVVNGFPSGVHWQEAKERIRYLERHYLQVR